MLENHQQFNTTIPFVTPLIKMGQLGFRYWTSERHNHNHGSRGLSEEVPSSWLPIYTLRLPGVHLYIVNSTSVIPLVQRKSRIISFAPVIVWMAKPLMALSDADFKVASQDPLEDHGFAVGTTRAIHPTLAPGPRLYSLTRNSVIPCGVFRHINQQE
jgi:hypothetical protein